MSLVRALWLLVPGWARLAFLGAALAAVWGFYGWRVHVEREVGRSEVQAKFDSYIRQQEKIAGEQAARNLELQRAAETRYTVQAETREKFITQTIVEIRREAAHLDACTLGPAVRLRLNASAACALDNSPAACRADQQMHGTGAPGRVDDSARPR